MEAPLASSRDFARTSAAMRDKQREYFDLARRRRPRCTIAELEQVDRELDAVLSPQPSLCRSLGVTSRRRSLFDAEDSGVFPDHRAEPR